MTDEPVQGLADLEAEHAMQYQLLRQVEDLLAAGSVDQAREVAQSLREYSEAHFASEQVVMRLHSYPGLQTHTREHGDLLNALNDLIAGIDTRHAGEAAGAMRRWLTSHIHHADRDFLEFVAR